MYAFSLPKKDNPLLEDIEFETWQTYNPLLDKVEKLSLADLYRDHPNKSEKPETHKILLRGWG
jgi:hypothetical protein